MSGSLTPGARLAHGSAGLVGAFALAEAAVRSGLVDERFVPPPSAVLRELIGLMATAPYWGAVGRTLQGWGLGLLVALAVAVPLAILFSSNDYLYRAQRPMVEFLRPVPSVGLIPVAVLVFGIGLEAKVFLVAFAATWPLLVQTMTGLTDVDPTQTATAASYRISARDRLLRVVVPSALPYVATGVRIASTTGLIVALIAELVLGAPGLGNEITLAQAGNAVVLMYALILSTGLLGLVLNSAVLRLEAHLLRWHPSYREVTG